MINGKYKLQTKTEIENKFILNRKYYHKNKLISKYEGNWHWWKFALKPA